MVSSPQYDRVVKAIDQYVEAVEETLKDLWKTFIWDIVFIVVAPIVACIIGYFVASISGLLTVFGLGGVNAAGRFAQGKTILTSYRSDCSKLKRSVRTLEIDRELCDPSNDASVQELENKLNGYCSSLP